MGAHLQADLGLCAAEVDLEFVGEFDKWEVGAVQQLLEKRLSLGLRDRDLAGLSQGTAESLLKAADLVAKVVPVPVAAGDLNAGWVLSQGMPPGAEVAPGTTVEISVAVASG